MGTVYIFLLEKEMSIFAAFEKCVEKLLGVDTDMEWINEKAQLFGIETEGKSRIDVIHEIQQAEGNKPCFGTCNGLCEHSECCFYDACICYGF